MIFLVGHVSQKYKIKKKQALKKQKMEHIFQDTCLMMKTHRLYSNARWSIEHGKIHRELLSISSGCRIEPVKSQRDRNIDQLLSLALGIDGLFIIAAKTIIDIILGAIGTSVQDSMRIFKMRCRWNIDDNDDTESAPKIPLFILAEFISMFHVEGARLLDEQSRCLIECKINADSFYEKVVVYGRHMDSIVQTLPPSHMGIAVWICKMLTDPQSMHT